jgi:hypothetical protein
MFRPALALVLVVGATLAAGPSFAADCTRANLQSAVDSYIKAQTKGDPSLMNLASPVTYIENRKTAKLKGSILTMAQKIDFHRSLLDTQQCQTFTEVIITNPAHPYVLGTALTVKDGKISKIDSLVTDKGDWLFNAENDYKISPKQDWSTIPKDKRDSRKTLIAAANAYFDYFSDKSVKVPWGYPCRRLEGGILTGKGQPDDTCDVGVPKDIKFPERHFIVDPTIGSVVGLVSFGDGQGQGLPDSHLFRIVNGKIRLIHTITVCATFNCGLPAPGQKPKPQQSGADAQPSATKPAQH